MATDFSDAVQERIMSCGSDNNIELLAVRNGYAEKREVGRMISDMRPG